MTRYIIFLMVLSLFGVYVWIFRTPSPTVEELQRFEWGTAAKPHKILTTLRE